MKSRKRTNSLLDCIGGTAHHWQLGEPNGEKVVLGVCKKCGAERNDFPSSAKDGDGDWREIRKLTKHSFNFSQDNLPN